MSHPVSQAHIATCNMQSGVTTDRYLHYVTRSWHSFTPHKRQHLAMRDGGRAFENFELVALQEIDAGSWRTNNVNQLSRLAELAGFEHHEFLINRDFGRFAQHGLGVLSRSPIKRLNEIRLPGLIPGRGALHIETLIHNEPTHVVVTHLSLGWRSRRQQLHVLANRLARFDRFILMGDMNCHASEIQRAFKGIRNDVQLPTASVASYPSWDPQRAIDHIAVAGIAVESCRTLDSLPSDHLPIAATLVPSGIESSP